MKQTKGPLVDLLNEGVQCMLVRILYAQSSLVIVYGS